MSKFSSALKAIRVSQYLTQREFSKLINVPIGTYPAWERGLQLPSMARFELLLQNMQSINIDSETINELREIYLKQKII